MKSLRLLAAVHRTTAALLVVCATHAIAQTDITVGYIQRTPVIDYVQDATDPTRQGWPAVGSTVTWRGNLLNLSASSKTVAYAWKVNGTTLLSGTVNIPGDGATFVNLPRTWSFQRETIELVADPSNTLAETFEGNNSLLVHSDALSVGFWVERTEYEFFKAHQKELVGAQSNSFENWAQRIVRTWNQMHQDAITPSTPNGVLDRVRLDQIVVVADDALPLSIGIATNNPDFYNRTVDMQWGFPWEAAHATEYNTTLVDPGNKFYYDGGVIHELYHARYAVDNYGFNVHANPGHLTRDSILATEGGISILGTRYLPQVRNDLVYETRQKGLMSDHNSPGLDTYSAMAWNRITGRRAVCGNMNAPCNFGAYINDLSASNLVQFVDSTTGAPLTGASISVYRSTAMDGQDIYRKKFDGTADLLATTDANGWANLGSNPFSNAYDLSGWMENTTALVRVAHMGSVRYVFLEVSDFNMEYWRGNNPARVVLKVSFLTQANTPQAASSLVATAGSSQVALAWNPSPDADHHKVFQSLDGTTWTEIALLPGLSSSYTATDLTDGMAYKFRVVPFGAEGNNGWPTNVVTATPGSSTGSAKIQYRITNTNPTDNTIQGVLRIVNTGSQPIPYASLRVRYFYTGEGPAGGQAFCDWAQLGTSYVRMGIVSLATAVPHADRYLEVLFYPVAGQLLPGQTSGDIQFRLHKHDWSSFSEADDWSRDASKTNFADWNRVQILQNNVSIWGSAP